MRSPYPRKRLMAAVLAFAVGTSAYRDFDPRLEAGESSVPGTRVYDGADWWSPSNHFGRGKVNAHRALMGRLDVYINGPTFISQSGWYTWYADFSGGGQTPQYTWHVSWDGLFWSPVGSGGSYSNYAGGVDFWLRLRGTQGSAYAETVLFVQAPCYDPNGACA